MAKAKPIRGVHRDTELLVASERMIETRLAEMLAYERYVADQDAITELHQMRIAAKRLRYTLEIFQDAYDAYSRFGPQIRAATAEIEQIQENLGALHDADVLIPKLNDYLAHLLEPGYGKDRLGSPVVGVHGVDYDACLGLIAVCQRLRTEREKRHDRFLDHWQGLIARDMFTNLRSQLKSASQESGHEVAHPTPADNAENTRGVVALARSSSRKRTSAVASRNTVRKQRKVKPTQTDKAARG
jgi:hypothetical protein